MDGFIQEMVEFFRKYISDELVIFLVSMMPILELRGGLVAAALLGVDLWIAFPICVIGNMLPIPLVLLLIRKIIGWLKTTKAFSNLAQKLERNDIEKKGSFLYKLFSVLYIFETCITISLLILSDISAIIPFFILQIVGDITSFFQNLLFMLYLGKAKRMLKKKKE